MRLWSEAEAKANSTRIFLLALGTPDPANKAATEARAKAATWTAKTDTPTSVETWLYRARFAQRFGKPEEATACEKEILKLQRADGGWSWWNAGTQSDAMATGEALHFLSTSKDPQLIAAANRARNWLLSTQREDGGWTLSSKWFSKVDRSLRKGENTTKNADSIYTYWGSSWATLGLLQAIPVMKPTVSKSTVTP
jgi:squalene cyclase